MPPPSSSLSRIRPHTLLQAQLLLLRPTPVITTFLRRASSSDKPIVLEQPDKFRPPSHAARIPRRRKRLYYGKELSEEDKEELNSKQYPYAAPPKDSVMYKFLNNRLLHVCIAMSVLGVLYGYMKLIQFTTTNRYPELLPAKSLFFSRPIQYVKTYVQVVKMNMEASSKEALSHMHRNADDVERRTQFRKAHGIAETAGMAAWLGLGTEEEDERREKVEKERVEKMEEERRVAKAARDLAAKEKKTKNVFGIWSW